MELDDTFQNRTLADASNRFSASRMAGASPEDIYRDELDRASFLFHNAAAAISYAAVRLRLIRAPVRGPEYTRMLAAELAPLLEQAMAAALALNEVGGLAGAKLSTEAPEAG